MNSQRCVFICSRGAEDSQEGTGKEAVGGGSFTPCTAKPAAGGSIERIVLLEALRAKLAEAGTAHAPQLYAEAGVWYDALTVISALLDAAPHDPVHRRQRASLLQQVGLAKIAEHDLRHSRAN